MRGVNTGHWSSGRGWTEWPAELNKRAVLDRARRAGQSAPAGVVTIRFRKAAPFGASGRLRSAPLNGLRNTLDTRAAVFGDRAESENGQSLSMAPRKTPARCHFGDFL